MYLPINDPSCSPLSYQGTTKYVFSIIIKNTKFTSWMNFRCVPHHSRIVLYHTVHVRESSMMGVARCCEREGVGAPPTPSLSQHPPPPVKAAHCLLYQAWVPTGQRRPGHSITACYRRLLGVHMALVCSTNPATLARH